MSDFKTMFGFGKNRKKEKNSNSAFPWFNLMISFVLGLIVVFLLVQMVQFVRIRGELAFIDSLEENTATVIEEMSTAKSYLSNFGGDLNQIREYLLLPTKDYDFSALGQAYEEELEEGEDLTALVFTFVDRLGEYEEKKEQYDANLAGITEFFADEMWGNASLEFEGFNVYDQSLEGMEVLSLILNLDSSFELNTYHGEVEFNDAEDFEEVKAELLTFIEDIEEFRALIGRVNEGRNFISNTVLVNADLEEFLLENGIVVSDELSVDGEYYYYTFYNADGMEVTKLWINKSDASIQMYGEEMELLSYEATELGFADFFAELSEMDFRTSLQKTVAEKQAELKALLEDKAFIVTLEQKSFIVSVPEDTEERFSFSILDSDGTLLRTIYLDKTTGEVGVETPEEEGAETLSSAIDALDISSKKKLWTCLVHCPSILI